jgi:hypothetical protein
MRRTLALTAALSAAAWIAAGTAVAAPVNSLTAKLTAVQNAFNTERGHAACGELGAFINEVQAQSGKSLTAEEAGSLIATATFLREITGC